MFEKCEKCNDYIDEFKLCGCVNDEIKDNNAVDKFAEAMKEKLAKARAKGRSGWNDKEACSDENLADLFHNHLQKYNDGNFIDLANFLMFLHIRGAKPNVLSLAKEVFLGIMTREEAKKELDELEVSYGVYDIVGIIFDDHEAQLKAKDEEIDKLKKENSDFFIKSMLEDDKKARSIVAMLFWEWRRNKRLLKELKEKKADSERIIIHTGFNNATKFSFEKAYKMLKENL